jgi:cytochrome c-type biogenesis protein CcmE
MRRPARTVAAVCFVIAAALGFLIYQGLSNNLVYYLTPSELLARAGANGQDFRLGGQVAYGSRHWDARTQVLTFLLRDPKASIEVISHGLPPAMFREGFGVVVEGEYLGGIFHATNLMVKHCASYQAPAPGKVPKPDNCVTQ